MLAAPSRFRRLGAHGDMVACVLVFTAALFYLASLPRDLGRADESYLLLEAKRIARGEVLYRDIFYFATPGAHWFMALVFRWFGASMAVARLTMAVVHGAIAVLLLLACRSLGVRGGLAVAAAVTHVALCQPAWPYASAHWLDTLFMVLLLFVVVRGRPWAQRTAAAIGPGLLVGALAAVQQQTGAAMALGVLAFFAFDGVSQARFAASDHPVRTVVQQLAYAAAGGLAVLLPLFTVLIAGVGFASLFQQLVAFPLQNYRHAVPPVAWAGLSPLSDQWAAGTVPALFAYLPLLVPAEIARATIKWARRVDRAGLESLVALASLCSAAALSIAYFPDFIHVAYVAPLFFVALAEMTEAALRSLEAAVGWRGVFGWTLTIAVITVLVVHLSRNLQRAREEYPWPAETAFGHVDFASEGEAALVETVRNAMRDTPGKPFFAYPAYTSLYLTAGVDNPTPFPAMVPDYNSPQQFAEVIRILEATQPPYILFCPFITPPDDPVRLYIRAHYVHDADGPFFCTLRRRMASG